MQSHSLDNPLVVSGLGITTAIGQGKAKFAQALLNGEHHFNTMKRPGRQSPVSLPSNEGGLGSMMPFIGAEIEDLYIPESACQSSLRTASLTGKVALATLHEAWDDAHLNDVAPERIGLIVGGSNLQQRELNQTHETYRGRIQYVRPSYGFTFMDTDICGLCTDFFKIRGFAFTVGGASASGQLAIIQAAQAVLAGQVDACIAIGPLMDISYWECHALRSLGAMGSDRFGHSPKEACRPFDKHHDGFIFGEACGAIVLERSNSARIIKNRYARLSGWSMLMDGNRNPDPSLDGEINAINKALNMAKLTSQDIDYINPHGTGSVLGDEVELKAFDHCNLRHARLNSTKSIIGHGLSAAGTSEVIATLVQMESGKLHPSRNLNDPIDPDFNWVKDQAEEHSIGCALTTSFGFGGINTALCLQRDC